MPSSTSNPRGRSESKIQIALTLYFTLDTLNASGKMIGVISHVEGMKERIPAQIRVEKCGGVGYSRLRI